jgi:hypothetical protein
MGLAVRLRLRPVPRNRNDVMMIKQAPIRAWLLYEFKKSTQNVGKRGEIGQSRCPYGTEQVF